MIRTNIHLISFIKKKCVAKQCLSCPSCSQQLKSRQALAAIFGIFSRDDLVFSSLLKVYLCLFVYVLSFRYFKKSFQLSFRYLYKSLSGSFFNCLSRNSFPFAGPSFREMAISFKYAI